MKRNQKKYLKIALISAFVLGCIAILYSIFFVQYSVSHYENDINKVATNLHNSQTSLEKQAQQWLNDVSNSGDIESASEKLQKSLGSNPDNAIFCFENDSLVFWSYNLPIHKNILLAADTIERFSCLNSNTIAEYKPTTERWYVSKSFTHNQFKAVYVITIQTTYPYQNDFLASGFSEFLNASPTLYITNAGADIGWIVEGKNGHPLFNVGINISSDVNPRLMHLRWIGIVLVLLSFIIFTTLFTFKKSLPKLITMHIIVLSVFAFAVFEFQNFFTQNLDVFMPSHYGASDLFPSFGMLIVYVLTVFAIVCVIFVKRHYILLEYRKSSTLKRNITIWALGLIAALLCLGSVALPTTIINNSEISLLVYKIYTIDKFTIYSYLLIAVMATCYAMIQYICLELLESSRKKNIFIFIQLIGFLILAYIHLPRYIALFPIFAAFLLLTNIAIYKNMKPINPRRIILFIAFSTLSIVAIIITEDSNKYRQVTENFAESLSRESDPTFEALFGDFSQKLLSDQQLSDYVLEENSNEASINSYICENYFNGYFDLYDMEFSLCTQNDESCMQNFADEKDMYGSKIYGLPLWFMDKANGKINYLIELTFKKTNSKKIYISFSSRNEVQYVGYPELLLDEKSQPNKLLRRRNYSYAKYYDKKLVSNYGDFKYSYELNVSNKIVETNGFFHARNYTHYYVNIDDHNAIVLSTPRITLLEYASCNSFVFLMFFFIITLLLRICNIDFMGISRNTSFKQKSMFLLLSLVISLLVIVGGSILRHNFSQFEDNKTENIEDKMQMIADEINQKTQRTNMSIDSIVTSPMLVSLSNIYNIDINVYSLDGYIKATSRPEIFNDDFVGRNIKMAALKSLNTLKQPYFTNIEKIGKLQFNSIYFTYYNEQNQKLYYINLPYFVQQRKFNEKWFALASTSINIFIIVILLGIVFATIISNLLSKPLDIVRSQMGQISLLGKSKHIKYEGNDEIGRLVKAYNLMLDELADSAEKLAQTERETAWRKMARQIAHEIKNPLTPMQLSIQHVLRLKRDNVPNWQDRFESLATSLMEQINVLAQTATEFSNFAKMSSQELYDVNAVELLNEQVEIFRGYEKIKLSLTVSGEPAKVVLALRDQLQRVFTNLVKNAVQAIGEENEGEIKLTAIDLDETHYRFTVQDSGSGVSEEQREHLFQPNFTTKSSGSGLGLAISKNIIENFGGKIYYSPTDDGKTQFIIELPKKNSNKEID